MTALRYSVPIFVWQLFNIHIWTNFAQLKFILCLLISRTVFQYLCQKISIVTFIYFKKYDFKTAIRRYVYALHIGLLKFNYIHIILKNVQFCVYYVDIRYFQVNLKCHCFEHINLLPTPTRIMPLYEFYCEVSIRKKMQKRSMYELYEIYNTYHFERYSWKQFVM